MIKGYLVLSMLLFGVLAKAEIPAQLLVGKCQPLKVAAQNSTGVMWVVGGVHCKNLYTDDQYIEVAIRDLDCAKQLYVYDRARGYEFERKLMVRFVSEKNHLSHGAAIVLRQDPKGVTHVLIRVSSASRATSPKPIDIHLNMGGVEYEAKAVQLSP